MIRIDNELKKKLGMPWESGCINCISVNLSPCPDQKGGPCPGWHPDAETLRTLRRRPSLGVKVTTISERQ